MDVYIFLQKCNERKITANNVNTCLSYAFNLFVAKGVFDQKHFGKTQKFMDFLKHYFFLNSRANPKKERCL